MRVVRTENLNEEHILGKPIYNEIGSILLSSGVKLTPFYISKLMTMGIKSVFIEDDISRGIQIKDNISEKTRQQAKIALKDMMTKYTNFNAVNNDGIIHSVSSVIEEVLSNKEVMINVTDMKTRDESLYSHSVNVSVLATMIGIHMGYNMLQLNDIAIGAMLHDVGKVLILNDKKLLDEKKSDAELKQYIEKMHPKIGYDMLSKNFIYGVLPKMIVLMHHERVDGSGYPLGLGGSEINEAAMLVSICDNFDNMICGKNGEEPKQIYEAMEYLIGMSGFYYDKTLVNKFASNIAAFPSGSGVKLNSNERCLVIAQNKAIPLRPVVKVIYDKDGNRVEHPYEIDLDKELTLFIVQSCEI